MGPRDLIDAREPPASESDGATAEPRLSEGPRAGSTRPAARYPSWLYELVDEQMRFVDGLRPFPFDQPADIRGYLSLHQNDYLRLANHPNVVRRRSEASRAQRIESFSSPVFGGASREHDRFTELMQESMNAEDVVVTTAGWTANVGLLEAITGPDMPVYIDGEAHASLSDGIRLSRGRKVVARHNDPDHMEARIAIHGRGVVCIDAIYSTDGSMPDLARYIDICERHDCALVLDEAHSFGMMGSRGGGLAVELGLEDRVHFRTISLSKALGGHGGAIGGSKAMMARLRPRLRPVLFSSATSAVLAAGHAAALELVMEEPERAAHCMAMGNLLNRLLLERGVDTSGSASQILSIYFEDEREACAFYQDLRDRRILTSVFVFPAVPMGVSLVRFSVYADLTEEEVVYVADCTAELLRDRRLGKASHD